MITEETIKQTNFYKGEDGELYLVTDICTVRLVTLINCAHVTESKLLLGDDICRTFVPVVPAFEPIVQDQVAAEKPEAVPGSKKVTGKHKKRKVETKVKHVAGLLGPKNQSSQYKGVKKSKKPYADGRDRFEVSFYNKQTQKLKYLGSFDNELLAAATYQERAGNKDEAKRLRSLTRQQKADMAEQAENNQDKPEPDAKKKVTIYVCSHCKLETKSKPIRCAQCDGASFKPQRVDADSV